MIAMDVIKAGTFFKLKLMTPTLGRDASGLFVDFLVLRTMIQAQPAKTALPYVETKRVVDEFEKSWNHTLAEPCYVTDVLPDWYYDIVGRSVYDDFFPGVKEPPSVQLLTASGDSEGVFMPAMYTTRSDIQDLDSPACIVAPAALALRGPYRNVNAQARVFRVDAATLEFTSKHYPTPGYDVRFYESLPASANFAVYADPTELTGAGDVSWIFGSQQTEPAQAE
jgi:hypothetical protein